MRFFNRGPLVPVLRFQGPIGMATPLRPGLSLATAAGPIEKAFTMSKVPSVAIVINSPGGSPVQSNLIFRRIRQLAEEHQKRVYVFAEDLCASGGYFLAIAGDEIYADPSSIVGSIGVVFSGFGFEAAIEKLGVARRVYTSGTNKGALDPFLPEKDEDIARLKAIQRDVHETFIGAVTERRGAKLKDDDGDMFTGAFWSAGKAAEMGLIDGLSDLRSKMRELHGEKVRLKVVSFGGGGLLARFRRLPGIGRAHSGHSAGLAAPLSLGEDLLSAIEARALWSRFGF